MLNTQAFYSRLSTRDFFNASVRHIQRALDVLDECGPRLNIADKINDALEKEEMLPCEALSIVNMLLVDKWRYAVFCGNLSSVTADAAKVVQAVSAWRRFDFVLGYHHPELGFIVANPKNPAAAETIAGFRKNELLNVYAGSPDDAREDGAREAAALLFRLVEGGTAEPSRQLFEGGFEFAPTKKAGKPARPAQAKGEAAARAARRGKSAPLASEPRSALATAGASGAGGGKARMSPVVSVVVSNELFHNGNVEAWKRIILSYNAKYPDLKVNVYYEGERIVNINSLFAWGKVRHGSCIQFNVSGENIQDVAKLSRYLQQGASPHFAAFLKGNPDTALDLF